MNCKQGDLAIVVKSEAGNEGRICRCIRLASRAECHELDYAEGWPMWVTDTEFFATFDGSDKLMFDAYLRPIRDQPGQDETLSWAPIKETA